MQQHDPAPEKANVSETAAWRARHGPLTQLLGMYGTERFAQLILAQIPDDLWRPFAAVS